MLEKTYSVFAFRQQDLSPIQVAFVANAADVLRWAGIPRKSEELLTGFQRFLDEQRVDTQIAPFFQSPTNCSPTAIIVALRKSSSLGGCSLDIDDIKTGQIVPTTLRIKFDETAASTDQLFDAALRYVSERLSHESLPNDILHTVNQDDGEDEEELEESSADEDDKDGEIIHLGTSTLEKMKELLENKSNWSNAKFRKAITEYVKPAMLIDGQHRASGAAKIGNSGLPFVLCGLYDVSWTEQVFQFTVVNLKPKRLPPSTITAIAGLSLTRTEQDEVETRLQQAGVRIGEVAMMSLVAYDDDSPFTNLIDMNVGNPSQNESKLGYTVAKRIATPWYRATRKSFTLIAKEVFGTNNQNTARVRWRDQRLWFKFYCAFWDTVRRQYSPELWQRGDSNTLFIGATLWGLQEAILSQVDAQRRATWELNSDQKDSGSEEARAEMLLNKFLEPVKEALECLPEEMWTCRWKKRPEDTTVGRREVATMITRIISEGQTLGRVWPNWRKIGDWFEHK